MGSPTCISLFSGGMGLDLGLEASGFTIRFAADTMPAAVATARHNRPTLPFHDHDVAELTGPGIRALAGLAPDDEIDLVAGGPPCQSFSTAGKRLGMDDASRGPLLFEFVRLIGELEPRAFVLENVKGLLSASSTWRRLPYNNNGKVIDEHHGSLFRELTRRIADLGYSVDHAVLNAADFGVPQRRERVVVVGYRDGRSVTFPAPTHASDPGLGNPWVTVGEALHDLTDDRSYCATFSPRKLRYLRLVPEGGNWRDLPEDLQRESMGRAFLAKGGRSGYWRRLSFSAPAPTILTEPQNASTALCHPVEDRPLSVRECARIQTFPDSWEFMGRGPEQYRLVGNAVPVRLGELLGAHVAQTLGVDRPSASAGRAHPS